MDWSNERYVRLYVRDTVNWKLLGWEGQTVLMHVLRKLDRAGAMDLSGVPPEQAIEALTDLPAEVISVGLPRLLEREVMLIAGDLLVMPNFLDAQEAPQSDAERARAARERRRDRARLEAAVTKRDEPSQNVTDCHGASRARHTASHGVTPRHSYPSYPSNLKAFKSKNCTKDGVHIAHVESFPSDMIAFRYVFKTWSERGCVTGDANYFAQDCESVVRQLLEVAPRAGKTPNEVLLGAVEAYWSDPFWRDKLKITHFAKYFAEFCRKFVAPGVNRSAPSSRLGQLKMERRYCTDPKRIRALEAEIDAELRKSKGATA